LEYTQSRIHESLASGVIDSDMALLLAWAVCVAPTGSAVSTPVNEDAAADHRLPEPASVTWTVLADPVSGFARYQISVVRS